MFQFTFDFVYCHQLSIIIHTASCTKCLTFSPFFFMFNFSRFSYWRKHKNFNFRRRERRKTHRAPISCFCFHFITRFTSKEKQKQTFISVFSFHVVQVFPAEDFFLKQQQQINGREQNENGGGGRFQVCVSVSFLANKEINYEFVSFFLKKKKSFLILIWAGK